MKKMKRLLYLISVFIIIFSIIFNLETYTVAKVQNNVLSEKLNKLLSDHSYLDGALASVSIRSAKTGEILYDYNGHLRLKPASNLKLLTAVAALTLLGKDYRFQTKLLSDGNMKWGILNGNLYIKGMGDPTIVKAEMDKMVQNLKSQGVKIIWGDLIGDDTWYDDVRYSIDLPWSDETMDYGSPISSLMFASNEEYDTSTVILNILPGTQINEPALINVYPKNDYFEIVNESTTVSSEEKQDVHVERVHGTNRINIQGTIPVNASQVTEKIAAWNPTEYALHIFKQSLHENGIKLVGEVTRGVAPNEANLLLSHSSIPLSEILIPFMKLSNNGHGEILVKEMGKVEKGEGTWQKGLEVTEAVLSAHGLNTETILLRDGSGISHVNLIPAQEISQLLFSIQNENWFPTFIHSLPVAGVTDRMVGGTLRYRLKNTEGRVKAKTGTISTVSALSGYVKTKSGEEIIVSILINNIFDQKKGKELEDHIVTVISNS